MSFNGKYFMQMQVDDKKDSIDQNEILFDTALACWLFGAISSMTWQTCLSQEDDTGCEKSGPTQT